MLMFKYNPDCEEMSTQDLIHYFEYSFIMNWSGPLSSIKEPKKYIQIIIEKYPNLSRENIWYILSLNLIQVISKEHNLEYMNEIIAQCIKSIEKEENVVSPAMLLHLNNMLSERKKVCLTSAITTEMLEKSEDLNIFYQIKKDVIKKLDKVITNDMLNHVSLKKVFPCYKKNKYFNFSEIFFSSVVSCYILISSGEFELIEPFDNGDMDDETEYSLFVSSVYNTCNAFLSKNKDNVMHIFTDAKLKEKFAKRFTDDSGVLKIDLSLISDNK